MSVLSQSVIMRRFGGIREQVAGVADVTVKKLKKK
jgi:hypothetical protein